MLIEDLSKFTYPKNSINHQWIYNGIRLKRYFIHNFILFLIQFLIISYFKVSPDLPMYLPIGITAASFYFLGNMAFLGIFLGSFFGFLNHPLMIEMRMFYLISDIGVGYLAAMLYQKKLSSDLRPFEKRREAIHFILITALFISPLSALLKFFPLLTTNHLDFITLFSNYLKLWISDLNGLLVSSIFLFSWVNAFYCREKISPIPIFAFLFINLMLFLFIFKLEMIDNLIFLMIFSIIWSLFFGYLVSSALLFIISILYLLNFNYFIPKEPFVASGVLLFYILVMIFLPKKIKVFN